MAKKTVVKSADTVQVVTYPHLTPNKTICDVSLVLEIQIGQSIDYMPYGSLRGSMGKIIKFKYAGYRQEDITSVWMLVKNFDREEKAEWISVKLWYDYHVENLPKQQTKQDDSIKPAKAVQRPF